MVSGASAARRMVLATKEGSSFSRRARALMGATFPDSIISCQTSARATTSAAVLKEHSEPQEARRALVDVANKAGGMDNITAVVVNWR